MDTSYTARLDELKTMHRAMWGLGDYATVADTVIPDLGQALVAAAGISAADRVLDVAAGTGNAAIPAARLGAQVTATDLSDILLAECERRAHAEGLTVECVPADVEDLPFGDDVFDKVVSSVGAMFAPHHQQVADELVRVTVPGGTIALANWTPDGFIGRMFAVLRPYAAPPPAGGHPPPLWGAEDHVRGLFGDRVTDVMMTRHVYPVAVFNAGLDFRNFFKAHYGPTIAVYARLADQPDRVADLDRELAALYDRDLDAGSLGWGYLQVLATVRG